jgi:DNA topoisomerase-1
MKPLIIVESPAKCKKIEGFLDNKYNCVASFGHICELKDGLKCIDIDNNFKPKFSMSTNKNLSKLKTFIKSAKEVYLATDDDREGEAIAWHLCRVFKLPIQTTKRIIFHEITKTAIVNALKNPGTLDMNKVNAQLSRVVLDRLVGFTISPVLWKHISRKSGLSAGRCQTPALRLIYENQKEINKSPGTKVYDTIGYFTQHNLPFKLNYTYEDEEKICDFLEESADFDHMFSKKEPKESLRESPKPFTTSTLQQAASNVFNFSPKQTMMIAQKLYENGYITYMRTDSKTYSKDFLKSTKKFIIQNYEPGYVNKNMDSLSLRHKSDKAQEAHEAIRPTKIERKTCDSKFDTREKKLYYLIWKNTVQSCMAPARYNVVECNVSAPEKHNYKYNCEQVVFLGWKIVDHNKEEEEQSSKIYNFMKLMKNKKVSYKKIKSTQTLKNLKQHYSEARLVQVLEKRGIGRPSTFSSLVSKIQERNYVKKENVEGKEIKCTDFELVGETLEEIETKRVFGNEKNKLVLQELGKIVLEFLIQHYDSMFNYEYTSNMEEQLDQVSQGKLIWHSICNDCYKHMKRVNIKEAPKSKSTYQIDEYHTYLIGKYGPCVKYEKDGKTSFKQVKKGLTIEKIKENNYGLNHILDKDFTTQNNSLGIYEDEEIIVKKGKYGAYTTFKGKSYSLKSLKKINLETVIPILKGEKSTNPNVVKVLNKDTSIRNGKYGHYVYYKNSNSTKPSFLSLKGCTLDISLSSANDYLEWLSEKYDIKF